MDAPMDADPPTVIPDASHLLPRQPHCRYCGQIKPDAREMCREAPDSVLYHVTVDPTPVIRSGNRSDRK